MTFNMYKSYYYALLLRYPKFFSCIRTMQNSIVQLEVRCDTRENSFAPFCATMGVDRCDQWEWCM